MNQVEATKEKRKKVSKLFNEECFICRKKYGKNFNYHHLTYRKGELDHSDFRDSYKYNDYILPIIEKMPDKFALLCKQCHRLLGFLQRTKDDDRFERLVDLARQSRNSKQFSK